MELKTAFGQVLRELREHNGMAQDNLGPQAYVSRVESGSYDPSLKNVEKIAANLGMHPVELLARAIGEQTGEAPADLLWRLTLDLKARGGKPPLPPRDLTSPPL